MSLASHTARFAWLDRRVACPYVGCAELGRLVRDTVVNS